MNSVKEEILNYLQGPRNYVEGVELYAKYGASKTLVQTLRRQGVTRASKEMLYEELRKLAGITEADFRKIRQMATRPTMETAPVAPVKTVAMKTKAETDKILLELAAMFDVSVEDLVKPETRQEIIAYYKGEKEDSEVTAEKLEELERYLDSLGVTDIEELADQLDEKDRIISKLEKSLETAEKKYKAAPAATVKMIRFREQFTFLREDDCPDVLKILVADLFTAYGKYKEAHARLAAMPDDADAIETAKLSEEVVENFIKDREIWEELEYYQEHHELLGKCAKVKAIQERQEVSGLTDVELVQKRQSAAAQISKAKKVLEDKKADDDKKTKASETLAKWTAKKEAIEAEIEGRKKN